jgi:hypothetical protein
MWGGFLNVENLAAKRRTFPTKNKTVLPTARRFPTKKLLLNPCKSAKSASSAFKKNPRKSAQSASSAFKKKSAQIRPIRVISVQKKSAQIRPIRIISVQKKAGRFPNASFLIF